MSTHSSLIFSLAALSRQSQTVAAKLLEAVAARTCPPGRSAHVGRLQIDATELSSIAIELWESSGVAPVDSDVLVSLLGLAQARVRCS